MRETVAARSCGVLSGHNGSMHGTVLRAGVLNISSPPQVKEDEQEAAKLTAVFPCVLKVPACLAAACRECLLPAAVGASKTWLAAAPCLI